MDSLPLFHRVAGKPVILVGAGEAAEAKRRLIVRAGAIPVDEGDGSARIAFVALDDPAAADAAAIRLRCRGILVNVVDRPELCDFTTPSIVDRSPLLVAVGTGGASAGLAKMVRLRLEAVLPQRLGSLARALADARAAMRARWPGAAERRAAIEAALGEGGPLDPAREPGAAEVARWVEDASELTAPEPLEIRLTSDDPDDLTLRAARALGRADLVAFEPGVPDRVLARARADADRLPIAAGEVPNAAAGANVVILRAPSGR